ncbi:MAG: oxidoreductase domain-containing protein [Parcubacteria group bacterium Gr01-1014_70]|nr:MAG: oxidoreductase domain-containing protein [Parcubacteria group bacterium Gr01-1014_70]
MSIRFGIIGCSRVAERRFLPAIAVSKRAALSFVGSRDTEKARKYADKFHATRFGSYEDVLASKDVDAVYISTPPTLHYEWIVKAARAGKHIICEKPACMDYKSARGAVRACRKAGVRLMENYAFLYHPQHAAARGLMLDIGSIKRISTRYFYPFPPEGDIRFNQSLGGGVFHDSFGYPIALAHFYFGEFPESISCAQTIDTRLGIDIAAEIVLRFSRNRTLDGKVKMGSAEYASSYILHGDCGSVEVLRAFAVPADKPAEILRTINGRVEKIQIPPASQFQLALDDFCDAVSGKIQKDFEKELLARAQMKNAAAKCLTRK